MSSPPGPSHAAKLVADPEGCTGAGTCALTAPEVFDQDEDGAAGCSPSGCQE